jgi:serine/threonine-protein kinase
MSHAASSSDGPTGPGSPSRPEGDVPALEGAVVGGKYSVMRLIGTGGMGTVWEGVHTTLGTRVAIKFIRPQYAEQP